MNQRLLDGRWVFILQVSFYHLAFVICHLASSTVIRRSVGDKRVTHRVTHFGIRHLLFVILKHHASDHADHAVHADHADHASVICHPQAPETIWSHPPEKSAVLGLRLELGRGLRFGLG